MSNIRLLSDLLINQIAAGEVVQRPASVVKELIDNSIDAQSTVVQVLIKDAGKQLIQVIDNGIGMDEIDARMCFEKHATSKIAAVDDLFNIRTMGFRGEAMASIAAVSQLEIETRLHDATLGTHIVMEGSVVQKQEPIAAAAGTNIRVKNLFYNVPARRNFLKSNPVEFKHILEEVQHAALAQPEIGFSLYHNDTEVYRLTPEKVSHRIIHLFGEGYKKQLIPCEETTDKLTIKGYIGKPEQAKKTRGEQYLFVNQRFIKSPFLNHAIRTAYQRLLPAESFPFYVLYLTLHPSAIDVNVHPTKMEIKFLDEKMIYAIIQAVIKKSLATHHIDDSLDFEHNVNFLPLKLTTPATLLPTAGLSQRERNYAQFKAHATEIPPDHWQNLFADLPTTHTAPAEKCLASFNQEVGSTQAIQLYASYLVTQLPSGVLLIDQQAAHERVLYDSFLAYFQNKNGSSQQLLLPEQLELNPADYQILMEHEPVLRTLGFVIDPFGSSTVIIHGYPTELNRHAPKTVLEGFIEQFKWNSQPTARGEERVIQALAKRGSIPHGKKLTAVEIDSLLAQLFASSNTLYGPDGRKICVVLAQEQLAAFFK